MKTDEQIRVEMARTALSALALNQSHNPKLLAKNVCDIADAVVEELRSRRLKEATE